jgi:hypothetical protein
MRSRIVSHWTTRFAIISLNRFKKFILEAATYCVFLEEGIELVNDI